MNIFNTKISRSKFITQKLSYNKSETYKNRISIWVQKKENDANKHMMKNKYTLVKVYAGLKNEKWSQCRRQNKFDVVKKKKVQAFHVNKWKWSKVEIWKILQSSKIQSIIKITRYQ